jgi:hypothetical protein
LDYVVQLSTSSSVPEDKKLYYKANGESNLPVWRLFVIYRLKHEFGRDASEMLENLAVPARLTDPYTFPIVVAPTTPLTALEERLLGKQLEAKMLRYEESQAAWDRALPLIVTRIISRPPLSRESTPYTKPSIPPPTKLTTHWTYTM